ncbi:MAG TPA: hypothetical protein VFY47_00500 [Thermoleophilaceae bacterium]|nr:hypothetical protein [Thermoleophilaceae bacterium]
MGLVALAAIAAVLATGVIAEARVFSGSGKANRVNGCTAHGYLRVTIGSETLDVPVDCTTAG